jgi:hypothetical protein
MGTYLRAGLPLRQYVGFTTRAKAIRDSDPTIAAMAVFDHSGQPIFASGNREIGLLPLRAADGKPADQQLELRQTDRYVQVVLPLRNKFEAVGSLAVTMPRAMVTDRLEQSFRTLLIVAACLSVAFAWFASVFGPRLAAHRTPWLQIVYALTFLTMSGAVVGTLLIIYSEGAQTKTMALADTLGQRIRDIADFNLNLGEFEGLDRVFGEYRRLNPEITAAGLIVNGRVRNHTDPGAVGTPWVSDRQTYEYVIDLTRPERNANDNRVAVSLPVAVVYRQVVRSVKTSPPCSLRRRFLPACSCNLRDLCSVGNLSAQLLASFRILTRPCSASSSRCFFSRFSWSI